MLVRSRLRHLGTRLACLSVMIGVELLLGELLVPRKLVNHFCCVFTKCVMIEKRSFLRSVAHRYSELVDRLVIMNAPHPK